MILLLLFWYVVPRGTKCHITYHSDGGHLLNFWGATARLSYVMCGTKCHMKQSATSYILVMGVTS